MRLGFGELKLSLVKICFFIALPFFITLESCSPARYNIASPYGDSTHTINLGKAPYEYKVPVIQTDDFVEVRFGGLNPTVTSTLNNYGGQSFDETVIDKRNGNFKGQAIDRDGNLNFPLIGKVKAVGLTVEELKAVLMKKVEPILTDPYVFVGLPKRGVTIFGEVATPSTVIIAKEKTSIFEILASAGSSTQYADLSRVKVYREMSGGERILGHLNLNDTSFFKSEFFYPQPNDVVYVPVSKDRATNTARSSILPFITLGITVFSLLLAFIR